MHQHLLHHHRLPLKACMCILDFDFFHSVAARSTCLCGSSWGLRVSHFSLQWQYWRSRTCCGCCSQSEHWRACVQFVCGVCLFGLAPVLGHQDGVSLWL
jgi:hypothetical protein